ncbi:MAG: hypothetical protein CL912_33465 [Deltaproteobacteria bacterium]|nr:hypothetical protein [Deltaproteobacteria bacterium]
MHEHKHDNVVEVITAKCMQVAADRAAGKVAFSLPMSPMSQVPRGGSGLCKSGHNQGRQSAIRSLARA